MKKQYSTYLPSALAIIALLLIYLINAKNTNCLAVFNDEFGYWGNAAAMAGKDWTALMARTPYYSLGYSLFLVPLFKLHLQFSTMYRLAILMNIFLYTSVTFARFTLLS